MDTTGTEGVLLRPSLRQCLCKFLVSPACSQISTGAQGKQIHHHENLLADKTPLRGFCCCCRHRRHSLRLTQLLETRSPSILALLLQGAFLEFSVDVWLVHQDPRQFFLAAVPCFRHNFDLVARGMNRASIIYAILVALGVL